MPLITAHTVYSVEEVIIEVARLESGIVKNAPDSTDIGIAFSDFYHAAASGIRVCTAAFSKDIPEDVQRAGSRRCGGATC